MINLPALSKTIEAELAKPTPDLESALLVDHFSEIAGDIPEPVRSQLADRIDLLKSRIEKGATP